MPSGKNSGRHNFFVNFATFSCTIQEFLLTLQSGCALFVISEVFMPIPPEILAVERPKSTRVKKSGDRWLVIKRTCRRVGKRNIPVELGTIGEIIDGKYVEIRKEPRKRRVDVKDFGEVKLCTQCAGDMLQDLARVWDIADAKKIFCIAVLRAAYGDIRNRDLKLQYETSFLSEMVPGVALSENTVSAFLDEIGKGLGSIIEFMNNRLKANSTATVIVDGMLKDYNSAVSSMSEFSRKGAKKGSKDLSLIYAYSPELREPLAARPFPGNMLDSTAIEEFMIDTKIEKGLMIIDKGFHNDAVFDIIDKKEGMAYLVPLKRNSKLISRYSMDKPSEHLVKYKDNVVLFKKTRMDNGKWLYAFRDPRLACEQEQAYVLSAAKKDKFSTQRYEELSNRFGLVVFQSKADLDPYLVYTAYLGRWEIEILFNLYKNIIDRRTVNVHNDYRVYATEFINFLSVIIASRIKKLFKEKKLADKYSFNQLMGYISKLKKIKIGEDGKWRSNTTVAYIEDICRQLNIVD